MDKMCRINENTMNSGLVFFHNENLFLWDTSEIVNLVTRFQGKGDKLRFSKSEWPEQLRSFVLPLTREYTR